MRRDKEAVLAEIRRREQYWLKRWEEDRIFEAKRDPSRKKFFVTFPFPYMNGSLHLGHGYTATRLDIIARYKRMRGYNVLFPWAWHWTGEAVMGICHRIEDGDKGVIERLIKLDGVPPSEVEKFKDPVYLVKYFTERGREDVKRMGYSIDWTREFHTSSLHPLYTKFVEWQVRKLAERGFIRQGKYPVVWCPRDRSPTGDHDRMVGEGVRPEEYVLVKFRLSDGDLYLVAATFRPETIYGTTNVWLNPDVTYVIARVDGERWLISREAAGKLREQLRRVEIEGEIRGSELIGKYVQVPIVNRLVPVLPAKFVDPKVATGVVYSVPAHAPYDWLALRELKERADQLPEELGEVVKGLYPISIISVEGYGEYPAVEICEKMGIKSQTDPRADEATHEIYTKEFHRGVMKDECFDVAGLPVSEAKEAVKQRLIEEGLGDVMYDLPDTVICRCGTRCIVKVLEDQWLLSYSKEEWKELAKKAIAGMKFYPEEVRKLFLQYVDWYRDWPCTRKTGLGTPFPYDPSWIVETLTDSTVYMAFYTISKYYNMGLIDPKDVDDAFFDYVLLGIGDPKRIARGSVTEDLLREIREEFLYWYPVDLRGSGKDLVGNHLVFYIFHHTAIFPEQHWPRSIAVNGFVRLEGMPMSKTKGIFISLREAMDRYGSDAVRVTLALAADGLEDPSWYSRDAEANMFRLEGFKDLVSEALSLAEEREATHEDRVFISKYRRLVKEVEDALEEMLIAKAGRVIIHEIPSLVREYLKAVGKPHREFVERVLDSWVRMLSLYAPFIAEEIWHTVLGRESYVSVERWVGHEEFPEYPEDLLVEKYAMAVVEDIKAIMRVFRGRPSRVKVYVAGEWTWRVFEEVKKAVEAGAKSLKEVMRGVMGRSGEIGAPKEAIARAASELFKRWHSDYPPLLEVTRVIKGSEDEERVLSRYVRLYVSRELGLEMEVASADEARGVEKAKRALPLKPALVLE